jgi:Carboxypeptidase regulatory-like domain
MRRMLLNRYTIALGAIAVAVTAWNLYVATHSDGRIAGQVVGPDGRAVVGATVTLREKTLTTLEPRATAHTDGAGRFVFAGQRVHHFALEAAKEGAGSSERITCRLAFRGQNLSLPEPLRLQR